MPDVLRVLFCGAGACYLLIRVAGVLHSLAKGVASCRPKGRFTTRHPHIAASPGGQGATLSGSFLR